MKKLSAVLFLFFVGVFLFATERLIVNNIEINGGSLSVCMTGKNPGGALMYGFSNSTKNL